MKMTDRIKEVAKLFHETYERLAPEFKYETRKQTAIPWDDIPDGNSNKQLMIAVCKEIVPALVTETEERVRGAKDDIALLAHAGGERKCIVCGEYIYWPEIKLLPVACSHHPYNDVIEEVEPLRQQEKEK